MTELRALVTASLAALVVLAGCTGDEPTARSVDEPEPARCEYLSATGASAVTGMELVEDLDAGTGQVCSFVTTEGPAGVTVVVEPVGTPAAYDALLPTELEATGVSVADADQAAVWSESETIHVGVVRVGGSAAKVTVVFESPEDSTAAVQELLASVVHGLPEGEYTESTEPGAATCGSVPMEELRTALGLPELAGQPMGDSASCALRDPSGVNLSVQLPAGAAGQEQLSLDGRASTVEGESYDWVIEAVAGLGDGALWALEPIGGRSGELVALFGDQLVRVSSSANEPGDAIKQRAVLTARVVGESAGG